ncbi:MAG: FAD-dependent monooxygenase [Paracoccaceae bacterium]|nr:FAD-dependent monooxygenase [Paracoccaceae bacterium]
MQRTGTAIVAGGSIGGLFAAAALLNAGWSVRVFERTAVELAGRGAGIVTHKRLIDAFHRVGASTEDLGVAVEDRIAFDITGALVKRLPYPQVVTSWDRIHRILRVLMPEGTYRLGRGITGYQETESGVLAEFEDGSREEADLIVGADGFRSAIRGQMLPEVQPQYSGYVVWRALADECVVPEGIFRDFGFFAPNGTQIVGYPIAGIKNDLRPGHRRYNFVWYSATTTDELRDMLTDAEGTYHPVSIPPPLVRDDVLAGMEADAAKRLPAPFVEIIQRSGRPFFTPIYDHYSPVFGEGRVALAGDAACVARPHVGMGVTKAAEDALALAAHVSSAPLSEALAAYSHERVPKARRAYMQARHLGSLIFDTDRTVNQDGRSNPKLDEIMKETAVPVT